MSPPQYLDEPGNLYGDNYGYSPSYATHDSSPTSRSNSYDWPADDEEDNDQRNNCGNQSSYGTGSGSTNGYWPRSGN